MVIYIDIEFILMDELSKLSNNIRCDTDLSY